MRSQQRAIPSGYESISAALTVLFVSGAAFEQSRQDITGLVGKCFRI